MVNSNAGKPVRVKGNRANPDTNKWDYGVVLHERATFHQFGMDYEEFDNGAGNYSIAIVELDDGTIITTRADNIQFLHDMEAVEK